MRLSFFKPIIISIVVAVLSWLAFLAIFALILTKVDDPSKFTGILSVAALLLGSLIAGRVSSREVENRLLFSSVVGVFTALPLFLSSVILSDWSARTFLMLLFCIFCVMLGFLSKKPKAVSHSSAKKRKMIARKYAG